MENTNINTKNTWKAVGIIFIVISSILAIIVTYLVAASLTQSQLSLNTINKGDDISTIEDNIQANVAGEISTPMSNEDSNPDQYLFIKDWGIKIKTDYANKIAVMHRDGLAHDKNDTFQGIEFIYEEFEGGMCDSALGVMVGRPPCRFRSTRHPRSGK